MNSLRDRAVAYFVTPEAAQTGEAERGDARAAFDPPTAGVLGAPADVAPVAALLSAELRLRTKAGCVLLADWSATETPATRAGAAARPARQLTERLAGRGLDARAQGRVVTVRLPVEPHAAGPAWRRASAAARCPAVWALSGPRPADFDPLLGELDLIVLVPGAVASADVGRLAVGALADTRGLVVLSTRPVSGGLARMLASSSIATSRLLGADVVRAVRAVA